MFNQEARTRTRLFLKLYMDLWEQSDILYSYLDNEPVSIFDIQVTSCRNGNALLNISNEWCPRGA